MKSQRITTATHHGDFLYRVAEHLYKGSHGDLSRMIVVFPNKRASLFFKEYLTEVAGGPLWLPECLSMSELPYRFTQLRKVDKVKAICLLYRVYATCLTADGTPLDMADSFDRFYGWGERLLADFNEIDRQLPPAVAAKVFENVGEYEALNDSALEGNDEALVAIKAFINHWEYDSNQHERERFMRLWRHLPEIHRAFTKLLLEQSEGYDAMVWRDALSRMDEVLDTDEYQYAFVGHNALSQVEQEVLLKIKDIKQENCSFYWDYDSRYVDHTLNEAGLYIRKNLAKSGFQNALGKPEVRPLPTIDFVSSSTDSVQVRYVTTWLRQLKAQHPELNERRIAIVLCDENLLQPLLHVIPSEVKAVNITKGFPIKQTIAYRDLQEAIKRYEKSTIDGDLVAYVRAINAEVVQKTQATHVARLQMMGAMDVANALSALNTEAYFKVHMVLNQFESMIQDGLFDLTDDVFSLSTEALLPMIGRLILQAVGLMSVPFHGEPICGVQIMGLLETRTLDFDHLLFVGANDGKLPLATTNNSFIPYPIRRFFGLPTAEDRIAVSAYYFNRLLHCAKHVTMLYNNSTSGSAKGEMSRFMWELLVDYKANELSIKHYAIDDKPQAIAVNPIRVVKTAEMLHALLEDQVNEDGTLKTHLSPSSLATYIRCPLKFYYNYVAKLRQTKEDEALLPANVMGTIFHSVAEELYKPLIGQSPINMELLERYAHNEGNVLYHKVLQVIEYETIRKEAPQASKDKIALDTIVQWLQTLFAYDLEQARHNDFVVHALEERVYTPIATSIDGQSVVCRVGGIIDRLDQVTIEGQEVWRIFDYKTGGKSKSFQNVDELFMPQGEHKHYIFQTFLYAYILMKRGDYKGQTIAPALFYLKEALREHYQPYITKDKAIIHAADYAQDIEKGLVTLINELFDVSKPFEATKRLKNCENCDFKTLCNR